MRTAAMYLVHRAYSGPSSRSDMNILTFTEARACLKTVMDNVCRDHIPTVITRQNGEHVVMVSLADFNSIQETLYLLGSEANAKRLMVSIAQLRAGKAKARELIRNQQPKAFKQERN